jgi:hypothetical protein
MEADWEFEVGGDAPVIDACWPGFVDLRWTARRLGHAAADLNSRLCSLPEVIQLPALGAVLERLNSEDSPVWTSKCDFWPALAAEDFDADELDAPPGDCAHAMACYIDLLPRDEQQWTSVPNLEAACQRACIALRAEPLRSCRVDLVVRRALIPESVADMGITAYMTACGATPGAAQSVLQRALATFARVLCPHSTVQSEGWASSSIG